VPILRRLLRGSGTVAALALAAEWVVILVRIARHAVYVSHDTAINYAHVWFVSDRLWHHHSLPLRMAGLGHGQAFTFPYGLVPWLTAAAARPLFGDRTVTLWLVAGVVGLAGATFWAFPELRRGWGAAAVLANPALFIAATIGQLPFAWASALLVAAIGCWRRGYRRWAVVFAAAAQVTHPAIVAPLALVVAGGCWLWGPREERGPLVRAYLLSAVFAVPAALIVLASPVFTETSEAVKLANFLGTLAPRAPAVLAPIGLVWVQRRRTTEAVAAAVTAASIAATAVLWQPLRLEYAWRAQWRRPDTRMVDFARSPLFVPGAEYRVLRAADGKVGMYQLLRAGGRLDSEFFPESILRRSWPSPAVYSAFLRERRVDYVFVWRGYTSYYKVNEEALLGRMAGAGPGPGACGGPTVCIERVARTADWQLFRVTAR
jgi:hypothetical protein